MVCVMVMLGFLHSPHFPFFPNRTPVVFIYPPFSVWPCANLIPSSRVGLNGGGVFLFPLPVARAVKSLQNAFFLLRDGGVSGRDAENCCCQVATSLILKPTWHVTGQRDEENLGLWWHCQAPISINCETIAFLLAFLLCELIKFFIDWAGVSVTCS